MKQTITLTFSESVENHRGNQVLGKIADKGFNLDDINPLLQYPHELYNLNNLLGGDITDTAHFIVFRNGLKTMFNIDHEDLYKEHSVLNPDTKCIMYGRVVNKKARHNLCFDDFNQSPEYESGKGTVIDFKDLPITNKLRNSISQLGTSFKDLKAEGNYYYNIDKCYIGWHGDTERKKVLGVRIGGVFPIHFRWYKNSKEASDKFSLDLNPGDIYIMSEKTTGFDWKKRSIYSLRHSAGFLKNIK